MCRPVCLLLACLLLCGGGAARADERAGRQSLPWMYVRGEGAVSLSAARLRELGAPSMAHVGVFRKGRLVPTALGADGRSIQFLVRGTRQASTSTAAFELVVMKEAVTRLAVAAASPIPRVEPDMTPICVHEDAEDRVHGALSGGKASLYDVEAPLWFLHRLEPGGQAARRFAVPASRGAQRLQARVYGTYHGPVAIGATWGGSELGIAKVADAVGGATLTWDVPSALVPAGTPSLRFTNVSPLVPAPPRNDLSNDRGRLFIDQVRCVGPCFVSFDDRHREIEVGGAAGVALGPRSAGPRGPIATAWILDAKGVAVAVRHGTSRTPVHLEIPAVARTGRVVVTSRTLRPRFRPRPRTADPLTIARKAEHVILAVPQLLKPAMRLAVHRRRTGLHSVVIDVRSVYDHYGHGDETAEAIRAFLARLKEEGAPLSYVVLAGDAIHNRTDWTARTTIPAPMTRTLWNGATPSDALYVGDDGSGPDVSVFVGRLPFRRAESMSHFVTRLIDHETKARPDGNRRLLRFLAGNPGMGAQLDGFLERAFRSVLGKSLDPAFNVEVTYANPRSPYYWPLHGLNAKTVRDLNRGCLVYTYVGHGTSHESSVRQAWDGDLGLFTLNEVQNVDITGPRPLMLVLASSTGAYDLPKRDGLGEALLKRHRGPLAYWGSTRFCNPVYNILIAQGFAMHMGSAKRVSDVLGRARASLHAEAQDPWRGMVLGIAKGLWPDVPRRSMLREGTAIATLLGDPATLLKPPARSLAIAATLRGAKVEVEVSPAAGARPLPDGTQLTVQLARPRNDPKAEPKPVENAEDPTQREAVQAVHRDVNNRVLVSGPVAVKSGAARIVLSLPDGRAPSGVRVIVFGVSEGDVHHGVFVLP